MGIRDLMETDCVDVDEILLASSNKNKKKKKDIKSLAELVKGGA